MTLAEAQVAAAGGPIRTPEMQGQFLRNVDGAYFLTGTCDPEYVFNTFDRSRTDWEAVGVSPAGWSGEILPIGAVDEPKPIEDPKKGKKS